jgi:hypothetical protein
MRVNIRQQRLTRLKIERDYSRTEKRLNPSTLALPSNRTRNKWNQLRLDSLTLYGRDSYLSCAIPPHGAPPDFLICRYSCKLEYGGLSSGRGYSRFPRSTIPRAFHRPSGDCRTCLNTGRRSCRRASRVSSGRSIAHSLPRAGSAVRACKNLEELEYNSHRASCRDLGLYRDIGRADGGVAVLRHGRRIGQWRVQPCCPAACQSRRRGAPSRRKRRMPQQP